MKLFQKFSQFRKKTMAGNTIIEVLVATVVVGLVLTALAASFSTSIQNSSEAQYREIATRLAQDIMETIRKDKNILSWDVFYNTPANGTYCVPAAFTTIATSFSAANLAAMSGCPAVAQNRMNFYRAITKTQGTNSVKITVYVYWNVGVATKERYTTIEQTFFKGL